VALVQAVIELPEHGWRYRRIAREFGVHREMVARYDRLTQLAVSKPSNPTPGSNSGENSKPANVTPGSGFLPIPDRSLGPPSLCQPLSAVISTELDQGALRSANLAGSGQ
jgi:hypothetical protein